jgi:CRISPR-associated exonuclease Cas4
MKAEYCENEYFPLSALQHFLFCKRQCALIHLEQIWVENRFTAEGRDMHERVDRGDQVDKGKIRIEYGLPLKSMALGLTGKADVVEFHLEHEGENRWIPFPVEYKRGKPKKDDSDKVQLCAQAICLEEMLGIPVGKGALFYGKTRRRLDVIFDVSLRDFTRKTSDAFHEMMASGVTPAPRYEKKCDTCSFFTVCMPKTIGKKRKIASWLKQTVQMDGCQESRPE